MKKILIMGLLLLTACESAQVADDRQCQSYGAVPGTNAYINCMATLAQRDATIRAADSNAVSQSSAATFAASNARLQSFINSGPVR